MTLKGPALEKKVVKQQGFRGGPNMDEETSARLFVISSMLSLMSAL